MKRSTVKYASLKLGSALIWILILILLSACQKEQIPNNMVAAWVTENQRYQGCYLLISQNWLTIGATDSSMHDYYILKVKTRKIDQQLEVSVTARDTEQLETTFSFVYKPEEDDGTLYFENQPNVIWKRNPYVSPFY